MTKLGLSYISWYWSPASISCRRKYMKRMARRIFFGTDIQDARRITSSVRIVYKNQKLHNSSGVDSEVAE